MSWLEWLVWRWDLRQLRKVCESRGHDITGPHLAAGGWEVYTCRRCAYRFRADRVVKATVSNCMDRFLDYLESTTPEQRLRRCACCGRIPARALKLTCAECAGHEDEWHSECVLPPPSA